MSQVSYPLCLFKFIITQKDVGEQGESKAPLIWWTYIKYIKRVSILIHLLLKYHL